MEADGVDEKKAFIILRLFVTVTKASVFASDQSLTIYESVPEIDVQQNTCTFRCYY